MRIFLTICLSIFIFHAACADTITQQRTLFIQAKAALAAGNYAGFSELSEQLKEYPLYPYLRYQALKQQLDKATPPESQIIDFLAQYADTPIASKLRTDWLNYLAAQQQWSSYIKYYQSSQQPRLQCQYLQALLAQGEVTEAAQTIEKVWLNGRVQMPVCEAVFSDWHKIGKLTVGLIYKRLELAFANNNQALIDQLTPWLPGSEQPHIKLWWQVRTNPNLIMDAKLFTPLTYRTKLILLDGIDQLAKKDPVKILALWPTLQTTYSFNNEDQKKITQIIALALARAHQPEASIWLAKLDPLYLNQVLREWRVRVALVQNNWQQVRYWIEQLPVNEQQNYCWRYWYARALAQLGENELARTIYLSLANKVDYYGLLASQQLQQSYQPLVKSELVKPENIAQLANQPAMQRTYELYNLNLLLDARREWQWFIAKADRQQLIAATQLAKQWHWYDRMITTAVKANLQNDYSMQYPLAFESQIVATAKKTMLDPAWLFAIMRQESNFMPDATSSVGALGLMQLMPRTAQLLINNLAIASNSNLLNVDINIQLGGQYLKELLARFEGNITIATAAYNIGPTRLKKYISSYQNLDSAIWVEILPWQETRNYVKHVLLNMAIYQQLLKNPGTI